MANERFDSIWDGLEDNPTERARLRLLSQLMRALQAHVREQGWTQQEAAARLGTTQPRISDLMRGKLSVFSIDALVRLLTAAGVEVEIHTRAA